MSYNLLRLAYDISLKIDQSLMALMVYFITRGALWSRKYCSYCYFFFFFAKPCTEVSELRNISLLYQTGSLCVCFEILLVLIANTPEISNKWLFEVPNRSQSRQIYNLKWFKVQQFQTLTSISQHSNNQARGNDSL